MLTAVVGGVIIHPTVLEAANNGLDILNLGDFNFPFVAYTYSIFPMILAAWLVKNRALVKKMGTSLYSSNFHPDCSHWCRIYNNVLVHRSCHYLAFTSFSRGTPILTELECSYLWCYY